MVRSSEILFSTGKQEGMKQMNKNRLKAILATVVAVSVVFGGSAYAFYKHASTDNVMASANTDSQAQPDNVTVVGDNDNSNTKDKATKQDAKKDTKDTSAKADDNKATADSKTSSDSGNKNDGKSVTSKGKRISNEVKTGSSKTSSPKASSHKEAQSNDWVNKLNVARQCSQLITVQASGKCARVQFHQKGSNGWHEVFSTDGYVGYNGITSHKREGDGKTPVGVYSIDTAFGIASNPGTDLSYNHINSKDYWVDDTHSKHYNEWVNTENTHKDWNSAEHMISQPVAYRYGLVINYNTSRTPGRGSAIFLHCSKGGGTAGCVAIPQSKVVELIKDLHPGARIVISSYDGIYNY